EAETAFLRALEIQENLLGPDDPSLAIILNNLGKVYWKRKDFARAEPLFQRARGIMRAAHGELSPEHALLTNALGALYDDWAEQPGEAARRAEAQRLKDEALRIARAVRGERHPEVSQYLHNLAVLLARQGDFAGAAERALRAVAIMLSLGLLDHPDTQQRIAELLHFWDKSGQGANKERFDELLGTEIAAVEAAMQAWVAEDPEHRHFGPPPFAEHQGKLD
ncbi:MAG: tetratricopeptide repeat protein, partial [Proteobacteria bacterium]|nr:tetratricopeptide repeat protein [Pseudomonadota bacterium]